MRKVRNGSSQPGDAYSVRLKDGRYGLCWVLSLSEAGPIVAAAEWLDSKPPRISEVGRPPLLKLNSFKWQNQPCVYAVMGTRPRSFEYIGVIEPTRSEASVQCDSVTSWDVIAMHILNEWRWTHDREQLVAETSSQQKLEKEERDQQEIEDDRSLTFDRLREVQLFDSWEDVRPERILQQSRLIVRRTIDSLATLPRGASESRRVEILREFIEAFNRLDAEHAHFIETVEREDIMDVFRKLIRLSGLQGKEDLGDSWREW